MSKVVKLNKILNKAIKAALKAVLIPLVKIIIIYFYKGMLLNCYKVIIIIMLKKANKNYFLLESY